MNGVEKIIKTEFWRLGVGDLEKIREELKWKERESSRLQRYQGYIEANWENASEYKVECWLTEICEYFNDCTRCPLRTTCLFAEEGCEEVYLCETCPRLRICVRDGSKGLFIYLRDSKNGGREE